MKIGSLQKQSIFESSGLNTTLFINSYNIYTYINIQDLNENVLLNLIISCLSLFDHRDLYCIPVGRRLDDVLRENGSRTWLVLLYVPQSNQMWVKLFRDCSVQDLMKERDELCFSCADPTYDGYKPSATWACQKSTLWFKLFTTNLKLMVCDLKIFVFHKKKLNLNQSRWWIVKITGL